jgi:cytochrome c
MRRTALILALALALPHAAAAQPAAPAAVEADPLLAKCTACHSIERLLRSDPAQVKALVERMALKNPAWFADTDRGALVAAIGRLLADPRVAARRAAWDETVARGRAAFADTQLGTTGKSCSSCHKPEGLRGTADRYPQFDEKLGRLVSLQERLRLMIVSKLGGKELPLGDIRTVALEAYLKSLQ